MGKLRKCLREYIRIQKRLTDLNQRQHGLSLFRRQKNIVMSYNVWSRIWQQILYELENLKINVNLSTINFINDQMFRDSTRTFINHYLSRKFFSTVNFFYDPNNYEIKLLKLDRRVQPKENLFVKEKLYILRNRKKCLHIASIINSSAIIKSLKCGNSILTYDSFGQTPIHAAIEWRNNDSLKVYCQLFESNGQIGKNLNIRHELKDVFDEYNNEGYTPLHYAVLHNHHELVKNMLNFCIKNKIDVLSMEAMGEGDSILHLAVKKNLNTMVDTITSVMPEARYRPNYAGYLAIFGGH